MVATNKSPGRTPPFILIGLLVIAGFLGYSYWSLSSVNSQLSARLDTVLVEKREADLTGVESEKKLSYARDSLIKAQESLNYVKKQLQSKESELSSVKTELKNKQTSAENAQNQLNQCDASLAELKSNVEALKSEKIELEKQLQEQNAKPVVCNIESCKVPVRDILTVAAKLIGSDALSKALSEAKLEGITLMEGIQFPAPVVKQPAENTSQQTPNQQQQAPKQPEKDLKQPEKDPKQNEKEKVAADQAKNSEDEKGSQNIKEMSAVNGKDNVPQPDAVKKANESLVFQSDKENSISKISKQDPVVESEKKDKIDKEDQMDNEENDELAATTSAPESKIDNKNKVENEKAGDKTADEYDAAEQSKDKKEAGNNQEEQDVNN